MKIVTFKIDEVLLEMLERYAAERKLTRSEVIRLAIRQYLKQNHLKPTQWRVKKVTLK